MKTKKMLTSKLYFIYNKEREELFLLGKHNSLSTFNSYNEESQKYRKFFFELNCEKPVFIGSTVMSTSVIKKISLHIIYKNGPWPEEIEIDGTLIDRATISEMRKKIQVETKHSINALVQRKILPPFFTM